jgi:hypothetical protein
MSRCILDNEETGVEVVAGWDPGLGTFFTQVIVDDDEGPAIWRGTTPGEITHQDALLGAIREIAPYACPFDEGGLLRALMEDKRTGSEKLFGPEDLGDAQ